MLISSEVGAAQIVSPRDDTRFYDDVECLAVDWAKRPAGAVAYVRVSTGAWVNAELAWYARPPAAQTAMGSGIVAFAGADTARAADREGRALTWNEAAGGVP